MAKMHSSFVDFNDAIKLSSSKEDELRTSRDAIRNTAKKWLSDNGHGSASFRMQGSIAMRTPVNPVDGGEYDVDDCVSPNPASFLFHKAPVTPRRRTEENTAKGFYYAFFVLDSFVFASLVSDSVDCLLTKTANRAAGPPRRTLPTELASKKLQSS